MLARFKDRAISGSRLFIVASIVTLEASSINTTKPFVSRKVKKNN